MNPVLCFRVVVYFFEFDGKIIASSLGAVRSMFCCLLAHAFPCIAFAFALPCTPFDCKRFEGRLAEMRLEVTLPE